MWAVLYLIVMAGLLTYFFGPLGFLLGAIIIAILIAMFSARLAEVVRDEIKLWRRTQR